MNTTTATATKAGPTRDLHPDRLDAIAAARTERDDLNAEELAEALELVDGAIADLKDMRTDIFAALSDVFDGPIVTASGRILDGETKPNRTKWQKAKIRDLIIERRTRQLVDPATGDMVAALMTTEIGDTLEVRTGVNVCRALDVEPRDYCDEKWVTALGWIK